MRQTGLAVGITILWFNKSDDYIFNLDNVRVPASFRRYLQGTKKGLPSGNPLVRIRDIWKSLKMILKPVSG